MMVWLHQSGAGPPMGSIRFFDTCSLAATNDISFAGMALNPPDREVQQGVPFKTDIPKDSIRSYPYVAFRLKYSQATLDEKVTIQTLVKEFHQIMRTISRNTGVTWVPKNQMAMKKVSSV
jgi:hypothetical protein